MSHASTTEENSSNREFAIVAEQVLCESATELFATYGKQLSKCSPEMPAPQPRGMVLGAAIGFTGEFVRGALAIAVDEELAVDLDPLAADKRRRGAQQDWIGELANQLLGRVKNKLLAYNVEVALSTPIVVEGVQLRMSGVHTKGIQMAFCSGGHCADVWWDAEVDPALVLSKEGAPEVQAEGEMLLF